MQEIKSPSYIHFREQESRYARMFYTYEICTSSSRMSTQSVTLPVSSFSNFGRVVSRKVLLCLSVCTCSYCILASV